jgi:hypothetical protein
MCSDNDHPPYDLTETVPTCDALTALEVVRPGGYGIERVPCRQTRGLSAFRDYMGQTRRACGAYGHAANVVRRFGVLENEPDWALR